MISYPIILIYIMCQTLFKHRLSWGVGESPCDAYVLVGETDKSQVPYIYDTMSGDENYGEK